MNLEVEVRTRTRRRAVPPAPAGMKIGSTVMSQASLAAVQFALFQGSLQGSTWALTLATPNLGTFSVPSSNVLQLQWRAQGANWPAALQVVGVAAMSPPANNVITQYGVNVASVAGQGTAVLTLQLSFFYIAVNYSTGAVTYSASSGLGAGTNITLTAFAGGAMW